MRTAKLLVAWMFLFSLIAQEANAQRFKLPFGKSKPEEQQQSTNLAQESGPWLIMCSSFVGEDGRQQARRLAQELSEKHRLKTYLYSHKFDFGADVASRGLGYSDQPIQNGQIPRPAKMKTATNSRFEEIAVLIGDFPTVDDPQAQKILSAIKTFHPESMANMDPNKSLNEKSQPVEQEGGAFLGGAWREFSKSKGQNSSNAGPLRAAFMMPNPLLPDEYFEARKVDEWVLKINKPFKYGLLKNESMFTVKIATFGGESTFQLDQMQKTQEADAWRKSKGQENTESKLTNSGKKATVLADFLRKQGVEAYEFHDRYESYVCVGGFDWMVQTDNQGIKRNNPEMVDVIQKYKGKPANIRGKQGAIQSYPLPKELAKAGIACDIQPIPVLVPKSTEKTASRMFSRFK